MELKKSLTLLDLFCIATGAMISSGLFILPGLAFSKAGPSIILSYLLAGILCIPTLFSKAELTSAMPKAGICLRSFCGIERTAKFAFKGFIGNSPNCAAYGF